jgi:hypothetical protein
MCLSRSRTIWMRKTTELWGYSFWDKPRKCGVVKDGVYAINPKNRLHRPFWFCLSLGCSLGHVGFDMFWLIRRSLWPAVMAYINLNHKVTKLHFDFLEGPFALTGHYWSAQEYVSPSWAKCSHKHRWYPHISHRQLEYTMVNTYDSWFPHPARCYTSHNGNLPIRGKGNAICPWFS